jgi:hypothetical protein
MLQHGLHQHGHQTTQTHGAGVVFDVTVVVSPGSGDAPGPATSVVLVGPADVVSVVVVVSPFIIDDVVVDVVTSSVVVVGSVGVSFGAVGTDGPVPGIVVDSVMVVVESFGAVGTEGVFAGPSVVVESFGAVGTEGVFAGPSVVVGAVVVSLGAKVDGGGRG